MKMQKSEKIHADNEMNGKNQILLILWKAVYQMGVYFVGFLIANLVIGQTGLAGKMQQMSITGVCMAFGGVLLCFTFRKGELNLDKTTHPYFAMIGALLVGIGACVTLNCAFSYLPWDEIQGEYVAQDSETMYAISFPSRLIIYAIVAPIAEELLFRGVIFGSCRKVMPKYLAILLSAVLFGIYHGNLMQGSYALLMGIILATVYEWTGRFVTSILIHVAANLTVNICYEFEEVSKCVYSVWGMLVAIIITIAGIIILQQSKNICSKK